MLNLSKDELEYLVSACKENEDLQLKLMAEIFKEPVKLPKYFSADFTGIPK